MNITKSLSLLLTSLLLSNSAHAALLAYEGFDYDVGNLAGQNGGTGFASGWVGNGSTPYVYDETTDVTFDGRTLDWDGQVDGFPTNPGPPSARYIAASSTSGSSNNAGYRQLSQSALSMAGADSVLWMSGVFRMQYLQFGAGVNFGLGSGAIANRGAGMTNVAGRDFIGVTGRDYAANNWDYELHTSFWDSGAAQSGGTANASSQSLANATTNGEMIVLLKYTFGAADAHTIQAYYFLEGDTLLESTFNANAVTGSYTGVDASALTYLSYVQGRTDNPLDEFRIGDTFDDVVGIPEPSTAVLIGLGGFGLLVRRRR